ncbi:hypothetical protein AALB53_07450 [Lachnospiraceae bacterium 47-T17]
MKEGAVPDKDCACNRAEAVFAGNSPFFYHIFRKSLRIFDKRKTIFWKIAIFVEKWLSLLYDNR